MDGVTDLYSARLALLPFLYELDNAERVVFTQTLMSSTATPMPNEHSKIMTLDTGGDDQALFLSAQFMARGASVLPNGKLIHMLCPGGVH